MDFQGAHIPLLRSGDVRWALSLYIYICRPSGTKIGRLYMLQEL